MKDKITGVRKYGFLFMDGKYYQMVYAGDNHAGFTLVNKETYDAHVNKMREIVDKLRDSLDRDAVLMEALSKADDSELDRLHKKLYSKKKPTIKTREHHCVDMKIGGLTLPIVE